MTMSILQVRRLRNREVKRPAPESSSQEVRVRL